MPLDPVLLAAIDRRLWKDLGFQEPEPGILRFLPLVCVAWSDGRLGDAEAEFIRAHMTELDEVPRAWLKERLLHPPGPYFRYQVAHLIAFMRCVWPQAAKGPDCWTDAAREWTEELIEEGGWWRRVFGGLRAENRTRDELVALLEHGRILPTERIWALARGMHAEGEPRRLVAMVEEGEVSTLVQGVVLDGLEEADRLAVAAVVQILRDEDLPTDQVSQCLARSRHLPDPERWVLLAELIFSRGRPLTERQRKDLLRRVEEGAQTRVEQIPFTELSYLEDHLARDARWLSWVPGQLDELSIDREEVRREEAPGTFCAPRSRVHAEILPNPCSGPDGLGFVVLVIRADDASLRLATPRLLREPATPDAIAWIARFLPATADPFTQLVLDEASGRWVAEVHSHVPTRHASVAEPLPAGRALLVPPWIWYRACWALGLRPDGKKRKEQT